MENIEKWGKYFVLQDEVDQCTKRGVATAGIIHITHASFLREPGGGGGGFTSSCKTKYLPKMGLYRYVTRTNVSFFDPSPNDERTEYSCA